MEHLSILVYFFNKSSLAVAYLKLEYESRNLIDNQEYYKGEEDLNN